jgi:RNA-directed DNA polymerase
MSLLKRIKEASSLADVAFILGFSPQSLAFVLYKIPDNEKYLSFKIPKKNGGDREISAPEPRLKNLQRRLANVLNACSAELDKEKNKKNLAHGFKKKFSIHTNANLHKNRRFVLNFDLQDFFPTINFGRVRGYFIRNRDFELHPKVATIFAQIACHKNELPQGSPCSPVISNFIAHLLDVRLVQCAKQYGCSYTRYADDITFSTNQKVFPEKIAFQATNAQKVWCLGRMVEEQVKRSGFQINQGKTRMRHYDIRQVVTGLVVNKKVNVRSEYYKLARAMSHSLFKTGKYSIPGYLSPVDIIEHDLKRSHETELSRLEGILNYIHYTRDLSDLRDLEEKQGTLTSTTIWKLFKRFLFFKNFGWLDKPVVICEGITDSIYLKLALKRLWVSFPALIERVGLLNNRGQNLLKSMRR